MARKTGALRQELRMTHQDTLTCRTEARSGWLHARTELTRKHPRQRRRHPHQGSGRQLH